METTKLKKGIAFAGGICLAVSIGLNVYQYRQSIKPVQTVEKDKFVIHKTGWKEWEIYLKDSSQRLVPQQGENARGVELFGYDK
ncbi:hypothetical protein SY212_04260 [Ligilactobacillus agilis]|uniref:Uncharacterized protein n=1 Tax=Ligilactobacillus agilis TaxID=1601 RepID=A0A6F9XJH2_9LACO|nr:hypothetical protein [Ligilactobacillus agilis]GET05396.1 hypothetical protein SY212_04260 [Ligilactobacillus agilis]